MFYNLFNNGVSLGIAVDYCAPVLDDYFRSLPDEYSAQRSPTPAGAERWREDYLIAGTEGLDLHHLYRAMAFLGQEIESRGQKTLGTPRCLKDLTLGRAL